MKEVGLDVSTEQPKFLSEDLARSAALLITMGCGEACPVVPGVSRDDWPVQEPKGQPIERVREIRDEIRSNVLALIEAE